MPENTESKFNQFMGEIRSEISWLKTVITNNHNESKDFEENVGKNIEKLEHKIEEIKDAFVKALATASETRDSLADMKKFLVFLVGGFLVFSAKVFAKKLGFSWDQ
jgi:uncharacterized protein Yka (UPF0111/DUF47 family)